MSILAQQECRTCHQVKTADEFPKGAGQYRCKPCCAESTRKWYQSLSVEQKKDFEFRKNLWRRFKMRPAEYLELAKDGCAVCGTTENLCVDHDHNCCPTRNTCGKCIRGVLCSRHNQGEGYFKTVEEISSLLAYRLKFEKDELD